MNAADVFPDLSIPIQMLPNGKEWINFTVYSQAEANGVTVLNVASVISLIAVIGLLSALALSAFNTRFSSNDQLFVRTHVAAYFISLLVCEMLQSVGSIMSIKWVQNMGVQYNRFCIVQAIFKQTADVGCATWAFILALHTFCVLFLKWKPRAYARWLTLLAGWSFIFTVAIAGPAMIRRTYDGPFHGVAGYWCWIAPSHEVERLTLDYMIMFLSVFFSFILYILVFLHLRGNIMVSGWHISFRKMDHKRNHSWSSHNFNERQLLVIARQMLMYPIAYTLIILPIAAARFSYFTGHPVPFAVTIFCDTIYMLSGFINVILFSTTRRVLPARSVLKLVISRPEVQEPDWIDPDSYYPEIEKDDASVTRDVEKMGPAPGSAKPPATPIFQRTESYESDSYYNDSGSERSIPMEHNERPVAQRPASPHDHYVPQLHMPEPAHTHLDDRHLHSPEDGHDVGRDSIYELYDNRHSTYPQNERGRQSSDKSHKVYQLHDVSLD